MSPENAPDPLDVAVGNRIRLTRKARGISAQTLGEHLDVSFQQVTKYEKGSNRVSASMLIRIAHRLDTTVAALVGEDETIKAAPDELSAFICSPAGLRLAEAAKALPANAQASLINVALAMRAGGSFVREIADARGPAEIARPIVGPVAVVVSDLVRWGRRLPVKGLADDSVNGAPNRALVLHQADAEIATSRSRLSQLIAHQA